MIGKDIDCSPEQYRVWEVLDRPDFKGEKYTGIKAGSSPLENITAYMILNIDSPTKFNLPVVNDPDVESWMNTKKLLPENISNGQLAIIGNYIYIFGGESCDKIYRAKINDPTDWEVTKGKLPSKLSDSHLAIINDTIYLFGGKNKKSLKKIFSAKINDPLNWQDHGELLPKNIQDSQLAIIGDYIYLFGGFENTKPISNILRANINSPLLWEDTNKFLPKPLYNSTLFISSNSVFLCGGQDINSNIISDVFSAKLEDPMCWNYFGNLPSATASAQCFTIGDKIYLMQGKVNSNDFQNKTKIYSTNFDKPGKKWRILNSKINHNVLDSHIAIIYDRIFIFGGNGTLNISVSAYKAKFNINSQEAISYYEVTRKKYSHCKCVAELFITIGFSPWKTHFFY